MAERYQISRSRSQVLAEIMTLVFSFGVRLGNVRFCGTLEEDFRAKLASRHKMELPKPYSAV